MIYDSSLAIAHNLHDCILVSKPLIHYPGNGFAKRTLEEKSKQSESSDEELNVIVHM